MLQSEYNKEMIRNLKRVAESSERIADALEMLVDLQRTELEIKSKFGVRQEVPSNGKE